METSSFFKVPPKAERAFLSPYGAEEMAGLYGVRIETEPLIFSDPELDRELEPEIILDHLALSSMLPEELAHTRYVPTQNDSAVLGYEGSFYFLAEHNWVDLKEIRFVEAKGDSVLAEFDLVIHLPIKPPDEYPLVLRVQTKIVSKEHRIQDSQRAVEGIGVFRRTDDELWQCFGKYNGHNVEIELSADANSFDRIASFAHSVIVEHAISPISIRKEIAEGIDCLDWKFKEFNVTRDFRVEDFVPRSFYLHKRRHHDAPEVIIVLDYPIDVGHWSLSFTGTKHGHLTWVPKD